MGQNYLENCLFNLRRIRDQMRFGVIMLLIIVSVLSAASLQGVLKFRKLTKSIRERSLELPEATKLSDQVVKAPATFAPRLINRRSAEPM